MAARLPTPHGDPDTWDTILNNFLGVSLNADGTLQQSAVGNIAFVDSHSPAADGITDDSAVFAAAAATLPNGGILVAGPKTYLARITLPAGVILMGHGSATTIKRPSGGTSDAILLGARSGVRDLKIDGNDGVGEPSATGLVRFVSGCDDAFMERCWATNAPGPAVSGGNAQRLTIRGNRFDNCNLRGGGTSTITLLASSVDCSGWLVAENTITDTMDKTGISLEPAGLKVYGARVRGNNLNSTMYAPNTAISAGIEVWSIGGDISGNIINGYRYGISAGPIAGGISTSGNTVRGAGYIGIEYGWSSASTGESLGDTGKAASGTSTTLTTVTDGGTAESGTSTTLTDTDKSWTVDQWKGRLVKITGGTGSGQIRRIKSNTATALTVEVAWATNPTSTSVYTISWPSTNLWKDHTVAITGGTGVGQTRRIASSTSDTVTVDAAWTTAPDNTSTYQISPSSSGTITGNIIYGYGQTQVGISAAAADVEVQTVTGNVILDVTTFGINQEGSIGWTLLCSSNVIKSRMEAGQVGIRSIGARSTITGNTVDLRGGGGACLVLTDCDVVTVTGNQFRNAADSVFVSGSSGVTIDGVVSGNSFESVTNRYREGAFSGGSAVGDLRVLDGLLGSVPSVAAAATTTLPTAGEVIQITGNTNITSITAEWPGRCVTLLFSGTPTVTDGSNLKLAGNFVAAGTTNDWDALTLVCDGTNWYETSRSVN